MFIKSIIAPIREIVAEANELANMRFDIQIPKERQDEIGDLQKAPLSIRDTLPKNRGNISMNITGTRISVKT
ncbi:MAG: HAMP domain-containing protein [Treponema sp.]|jgi:HAMP domain-containing protein|nr:HAMP domain-containing protein [Treponema sp.]